MTPRIQDERADINDYYWSQMDTFAVTRALREERAKAYLANKEKPAIGALATAAIIALGIASVVVLVWLWS